MTKVHHPRRNSATMRRTVELEVEIVRCLLFTGWFSTCGFSFLFLFLLRIMNKVLYRRLFESQDGERRDHCSIAFT
jgi:hypothetical protein